MAEPVTPNIRAIEKRPDLDTIGILEGALARARTGEVRSVVVIQGFDDSATNHIWSIKDNSIRLIGELMITAHAIAQNVESDREAGR